MLPNKALLQTSAGRAPTVEHRLCGLRLASRLSYPAALIQSSISGPALAAERRSRWAATAVHDQIYATFNDRLGSGLIDGSVWTAWLLVVVFIPWPAEMPGQAKLAVWLLPPLLCEPILVIRQRASIGQRVRGLIVAAQPGRDFPSLPKLFARHFVKLVLGGLSILYVPFAPRAEAVHDRLFGTVVTLSGAVQPEAPLRAATASVRRFLAAIGWVMFAFIAISLVLGITLEFAYPGALDETGDEARAIDALLGIVMIGGEVGIIYLAAKGRLPGTRIPVVGVDANVAAQQGDEADVE